MLVEDKQCVGRGCSALNETRGLGKVKRYLALLNLEESGASVKNVMHWSRMSGTLVKAAVHWSRRIVHKPINRGF